MAKELRRETEMETRKAQSEHHVPLGGPLADPDELAEILKVPKSWIYRQTRLKGANAIPRVCVGKYIRFHVPAVLEWLQGQVAGR